jgi:hypothetical protein
LANGTFDDSVVINRLAIALASYGGGKIIFDRPPTSAGFYLISSPILLQNNVTYEGVGPVSWIHNNSTSSNTGACFHGNGMAETNYTHYMVQSLGNLSANTQTVTCPVGTGMNFPVGSVVLIFSLVGESPVGTVWNPATPALPSPAGTAFLPSFSRQYRVVANGSSSDILILDYSIPVAVTAAVICDGTGGTFGGTSTHLIDRAVIRNLRVSSDSTTDGELIDSGAYEGILEDILVGNAVSLVGANGMARMEISGIEGFFGSRAVQLGTGSHDCHLRHLRGEYNGPVPPGTSTLTSLVLADEYVANIEISDFNFFAPAPAVPSNAAFNVAQTTGLRIYDGYVTFNGLGIGMNNQLASSSTDNEFRNVILNLSGQVSNLNVYNTSGFAYTPTNFRLHNVKFIGAAPTSTAACWFEANCDVDFEDVDFSTGTIEVASGVVVTGRMSRVQHAGWNGSFADINKIYVKNMIRAGGQGFYSAKRVLTGVQVTTTTATVTGLTGAVTAGTSFVTNLSANKGARVNYRFNPVASQR